MDLACGDLHDGISGTGREARSPEEEVVAVDVVARPRRIVRGRDDRVQVEPGQDVVHADAGRLIEIE